jgi:LAO/AO transport system kinase
VAEIQAMVSLGSHEGRSPEIVKTVATEDQGIDELLAAVEAFHREAGASGLLARNRRAHLRRLFEETLRARLLSLLRARVLTEEETERILDRIEARVSDPFTAASEILARMGLRA